jgi:hypothetical protein
MSTEEISFGLAHPEETLAATFYDLDSPGEEEDEDPPEDETPAQKAAREAVEQKQARMREEIEEQTRARAVAMAEAIQVYIEEKLDQLGLTEDE